MKGNRRENEREVQNTMTGLLPKNPCLPFSKLFSSTGRSTLFANKILAYGKFVLVQQCICTLKTVASQGQWIYIIVTLYSSSNCLKNTCEEVLCLKDVEPGFSSRIDRMKQ